MQMRRPSSGRSSGLIGVFRRACEIMAYAHLRGVRHRDLKPANIHIDDAGNVTILDWGLAHDASDDVGSGGAEGSDPKREEGAIETISGTPGYTAPEQIRGGGAAASADVYSLGVILSELLTGQRVASDESFCGEEAEHEKTRAVILRRMRQCRTEKPLSRLVERCLASDPAERPQDAGELLCELDHTAMSVARVPRIETCPGRGVALRGTRAPGACQVGVG